MYLPTDFEQYTRHLMGAELYQTMTSALTNEPPVSIRLNPFKCRTDNVNIPLADGRVPWCDVGVYLRERPNFTFDPLMHAGTYYVQDASSMFLHRVIRQYVSDPVTMLDLCAAPGGKSTCALAALPAGSVLFCNEPVRNRAQILRENIVKFGHPDVVVTNNYARDYQRSGLLFDVILTDVPCSGEGMFRKDAGAIAEWSPANVEHCRCLQREIVSDIWPCLKPGGLLIYSTCTFNARENEENAAWIAAELGAEYLSVDVDPTWQITGSLVNDCPAYRFLPGKTRGEGFCLFVLRKTTNGFSPCKKRQIARRKAVNCSLINGLLQSGEYEVAQCADNEYLAIPRCWADTYYTVARSLHVVHAGIALGTQRGKDVVPAASLALSTALDATYFPQVALDTEQAIRFLRKEVVGLPAETPRGFVLLTYRGFALGFEKNIGQRANNLYPIEWKIKSSYIPQNNLNVIA
nr:hypothetical protein [Hoylesella enoeca]